MYQSRREHRYAVPGISADGGGAVDDAEVNVDLRVPSLRIHFEEG